MSTKIKNQLSEIMRTAWQFVRKNGYSMSEALKVAWRNAKLHTAMKSRIVRFYFRKVDGSIREAFGTLCDTLTPEIQGNDNRRKNESCQTYYDTEKEAWRCYKKANLMSIEI